MKTPYLEPTLRIWEDGKESQAVRLREGPIVVGRSTSADVTLTGDGVSRRHFELLHVGEGKWSVRDLDSRNGTFVQGHAVREAVLGPADVVAVAQYELRVKDPRRHTRAPLERTMSVEDAGRVRVDTLTSAEPPQIDGRHLASLQDIARELLEEPDADRRRERLVAWMVGPVMSARRAAVVRVTADAIEAPRQIGDTQSGTFIPTPDPIPLSRTTLRALLDTRDPVLATTAAASGDALMLSIGGEDQAVIACPVAEDDEGVTALYALVPAERGTTEWLSLTALGCDAFRRAEEVWAARARAESAVRIERDLERAREVQQGLVPTALCAQPGLDLSLHFVPCLAVGGDYADVIPLADGSTLLCLADVCGKGIQAAMIASSVRTFVHAAVADADEVDVAQVIRKLDAFLADSLPDWSFVTMVIARVDVAAERCEVANAGHPPLLRVTPEGRVTEVGPATQAPLGILKGQARSEGVAFEPGDALAFYTDGLTEVTTGPEAMIGVEGLAEMLARARAEVGPSADADALASGLLERVAAAGTEPEAEDDQTLLVARRA